MQSDCTTKWLILQKRLMASIIKECEGKLKWFFAVRTQPDSSDRLCRFHIAQNHCGYCKSCKGTLQVLHCMVAPVGVALANPHSYSKFAVATAVLGYIRPIRSRSPQEHESACVALQCRIPIFTVFLAVAQLENSIWG